MRGLAQRLRDCRGTATVETAVVLPVYLMLLLVIAEFGHAQMVLNLLNSACRNGARIGSTEGTTTANVVARVNQTLGAAVNTSKVTVYVRDASAYDSGSPPTTESAIEAMPALEVADADPRQMFVVRAKVAFNDICFVPMPFLKNVVLDAQAFMRHE
jgi:Flp pilus assembly protein TadG